MKKVDKKKKKFENFILAKVQNIRFDNVQFKILNDMVLRYTL